MTLLWNNARENLRLNVQEKKTYEKDIKMEVLTEKKNLRTDLLESA